MKEILCEFLRWLFRRNRRKSAPQLTVNALNSKIHIVIRKK